jgi:Sulfotransferase domain
MSEQIDTAGASVLLFGMHRGGSSIIAELLQRVLGAAGYNLVDESRRYYDAGYLDSDIPQTFFEALAPFGAFYGPFRSYPPGMRLADLAALTKIVVVRDPRDCLVSSYFAQHGPHDRGDLRRGRMQLPTPLDTPESIDQFCVREADPVRLCMASVRLLCRQYPETLVFRYEDIYADPSGWLTALIARLRVVIPADALDQALVDAVFEPGREDASQHHRQGRPRNHQRKLSRNTTLYLTELFADELEFFGYGGTFLPPLSWVRRQNTDLTQTMEPADIAAAKRIIKELQRENGFRISEIGSLRKGLAALTEAVASVRVPEPTPPAVAADPPTTTALQ